MAFSKDMSWNLSPTADMVAFLNSTVHMDKPRKPEFRVDKARAPRKLPAPFEAVTQVRTIGDELWACDKIGLKVVQVSKKGAEDVRRLLRGGDFRLADWAKFVSGVSSNEASP